jgi:hypothetical protein
MPNIKVAPWCGSGSNAFVIPSSSYAQWFYEFIAGFQALLLHTHVRYALFSLFTLPNTLLLCRAQKTLQWTLAPGFLVSQTHRPSSNSNSMMLVAECFLWMGHLQYVAVPLRPWMMRWYGHYVLFGLCMYCVDQWSLFVVLLTANGRECRNVRKPYLLTSLGFLSAYQKTRFLAYWRSRIGKPKKPGRQVSSSNPSK